MQPVVVQQVAPDRYFADGESWDRLVRAAGVDPLFNGRAWQFAWWMAFADRHCLCPRFLEFTRGDQVIARAPLFSRLTRDHGITVRTLEWLGNLWRGPATLRSEFLDIASRPDDRPAVVESLCQYLVRDEAWDQLIVVDASEDGTLLPALGVAARLPGYTRTVDADVGYEFHTGATDFSTFRSGLGPGTRRRMFGGRGRLSGAGTLALRDRPISHVGELEALDRLHEMRWGNHLLGDGRREFLGALISGLPVDAVHVSSLEVAGREISTMLDVHLGERIYNLQGGFDPGFAKGVSPGRLHWGMRIEQACGAGRAVVYDLLAGGGRMHDFKADFAKPTRRLATFQVIRRFWQMCAYAAGDCVSRLRSGRTR